MQEILKQRIIEVDRKLVGGIELPETLILYTVDANHFVLSVKPLKSVEESALTKTRVSVIIEQEKFLIKLPAKIYNFYQMDESDYTVMASNKDPATIIVAV
jgi:hypothetical protein